MTADRPLLGILLMLGFCVLAPMGDSLAKLLGGSVGIGQLVTIRFVVQVVILVPVIWISGTSLRLTARIWRLTLVRTILHIIGIGAFFLALRYLPLADAVAIAFVMPFILLILGKFLLGENVGIRRIIACVIGFIGTLFVIQPSFANVGLPALLPILVAFAFAFFMLVTRFIAKEVDALALQAASGAIAVILLVPTVLMTSALALPGLTLMPLSAQSWMMIIAMGAIGTLAHLLMTWSLRFAPSATLAPMQYLEIPVAAVMGWLVFSEFPNGLALVGITITVAAGLYILARERALCLAQVPELQR